MPSSSSLPSPQTATRNPLFWFQGKVVVITGGASGIGKALAAAFIQKGARVALVDQRGSQKAANELAEGNTTSSFVSVQPPKSSLSLLAFTCDVADAAQVRNVIQQIKNQWGPIDIYCSNAGIMHHPKDAIATGIAQGVVSSAEDHVAKYSDAQWTQILRVNVQSHVIAARELLPDWEQGKGEGIFVITASAAGLLTQIGDASYGVSKAAAVAFAEHLAIAHPTIQVHCVCPQAVDTPFIDSIGRGKASGQHSATLDGVVSPEYVAECILQAILCPSAFWIFPHQRVSEYYRRKVTDHQRWLTGMKRLRKRLQSSANATTPTKTPQSKL